MVHTLASIKRFLQMQTKSNNALPNVSCRAEKMRARVEESIAWADAVHRQAKDSVQRSKGAAIRSETPIQCGKMALCIALEFASAKYGGGTKDWQYA